MRSSAQIEQLKSCFYSGKYEEVVALCGRKALHRENEEISVFQIASLSFLGDIDEATQLFTRAGLEQASLSYQVRCRFYLGVGEVRRSQYVKATYLFAANLNIVRTSSDLRDDTKTRFYALQGAAFFRFFRGQFSRCRKLVQAAYLAAFEFEFEYGQALALDLLGHALCQVGEVHRGLFEIDRAHKICLQIGNGGFATALQISLICYRAQVGIQSKTTIKTLRRALTSLDAQNSYSKSEIYLELSRQLVLRGRASEAQTLLDEAGDTIYKNRNKRQLTVYNHRYAHLLLLRGQTHAALTLARSLKSNLDPKIDAVYMRQTEGLERMILQAIDGNRFVGGTSELGVPVSAIDRRILKRGRSSVISIANTSEDPLGDLIDEVAQEKGSAFDRVKRSGFLGLIPLCLDLPIGQAAIHLGPGRGELVIVAGGNVRCVDSGITAPMKKLIVLLQGNLIKSKEFLVEQTWGYSYQPDVHDRLLHATIGKIRRSLDSYASWIEWANNGYRLSPGVLVVNPHEASAVISEDIDHVIVPVPVDNWRVKVATIDLNHRQIASLKVMRLGTVLGVSDYALRFRICKMTACRDLSTLHKAGKVVRMGRARATRYGISAE